MRSILGLSFLLLGYFFYGFYINQFDLSVIPRTLKSDNAPGYYDYKGVTNIHTNFSLGSASPSFVVESAKLAGLDFILLTDLNTFEAHVPENYYGNLLVLTGGKYSYLDSRFLHYTPGEKQIGESLGDAQTRIADLLSQTRRDSGDELLIMAHPFKLGFSWAGTYPEGLDGVEIINLKALSKRSWDHSKLSTIWSLLIYPFNSRLALIRLFEEPKDEVDLFDSLLANRSVAAFAGAEASARALPLPGYSMKFPSYHRLFEIASNHVILKSELTGNFTADRQKIFRALKAGQFYVAFDILGDTKGFNFTIEDNQKVSLMGSEVVFNENLYLHVRLPAQPLHRYEVRIKKDGVAIEAVNSIEFSRPIKEPGVYRVEVKVRPPWPFPDSERWISWIYSNPIRVKSP